MEDTKNTYIIPFKTYTFLKWMGLIACPAFATFLGVIGPAWRWMGYEPWVTTINASGLLIGALLGYSQSSATSVQNQLKEVANVNENISSETSI